MKKYPRRINQKKKNFFEKYHFDNKHFFARGSQKYLHKMVRSIFDIFRREKTSTNEHNLFLSHSKLFNIVLYCVSLVSEINYV